MTLVGAEGNPAPTLAALELSPANTSAAYLQVVDALNNMWHKAGVVHAELNESNILYVTKLRVLSLDELFC